MITENVQISATRSRNSFAIVSIPIWYGAGKNGTELSSDALKKFCLEERAGNFSAEKWYQVDPVPIINEESGLGNVKYENEVWSTLKNAFHLIDALLEQNIIPVVFGGDHTVSIASVAAQTTHAGGARNVGIVWIDAHGDAHTPETTPSGNIHGMPLAVLLGHGSEKLLGIGGDYQVKVYPLNVVHTGCNDLEKEELEFFTANCIPCFSQEDIDTDEGFTLACKAITELGKRVKSIVVSIDMDAFDETIAPGVHLRNKNGIGREKAYALLNHIKSSCEIAGIDVVEIVPERDIENKTLHLAHDFLERLLS